MAVESSSTVLVLCPTAYPSPPWVSLDLGWGREVGEGFRARGLGSVLQENMDLGWTYPWPSGAHVLEGEIETQANNPDKRQSGMRTVTEVQITIATTDYQAPDVWQALQWPLTAHFSG